MVTALFLCVGGCVMGLKRGFTPHPSSAIRDSCTIKHILESADNSKDMIKRLAGELFNLHLVTIDLKLLTVISRTIGHVKNYAEYALTCIV